MNYEYEMEKMKIKIFCKDSNEEMVIHNKMMDAIYKYGAHVKPKNHIEHKDQDDYFVRSKEQYKFIKDKGGFIIETESIDMAAIFCSCLNSQGHHYTFETRLNIVIEEKIEELAVINSFEVPGIAINENICGKRDPNIEQSNLSTFNFDFTNDHFVQEHLSSEILVNALNRCQATYLGKFIECAGAIYTTNAIPLEKNEILSIKFTEYALNYMPIVMSHFQTLQYIDLTNLEHFLIESNSF